MHVETLADGTTQLVTDDISMRPPPPPAPSKPDWFDAWEPTEAQVAFFVEMFDNVKDGAEWRVPSTGSVYFVDKTNRKLILAKGAIDEWHWKNMKAMARIGWTVELAPRTMDVGTGCSKASQMDPTKALSECSPEYSKGSPSPTSGQPSKMESRVGSSSHERVEQRRQILRQWLSTR